MAYIFHRVDRVWQEGSKLVPSNVSSGDWFGYDVDISGDTDIIGFPCDGYMGIDSGYVIIFIRRYN